jgi:hypothetical protein
MRLGNDLRRFGLCLLLAWSCSGGAALAQSHVDDADTDSTWFAFAACLVAGTVGFGIGYQIRFTRDIGNST